MTPIPPNQSLAFYRQLCDKSFWHFVKLVGGSVKQGEIINATIHLPLCQFWQDDSVKRKSIFMPRGWLKSTIFTMWGAIWRYLQDPNVRILIVSQNAELANRFLYFIQKQLLSNQILRKLYADRLNQVDNGWVKSHRWSQTYLDLPRNLDAKEPTITSIGMGGAAQSGHYDFIFVDDPVGAKHIDSPVELEKVLRWQDNSAELLINPNYSAPDSSQIVLVCTFWGPADYGSYVMEKSPEYHWRIVPALKDETHVDTERVKWIQSPVSAHNESNWNNPPDERYTTEYYAAMRDNPELQALFFSQHQNDPLRALGLTKFERGWIRYFHFSEENDGEKYVVCEKDDGSDGEKFPLKSIPLYGIIDPGGFADTKLLKKGSRNAIVIAGQAVGSIRKFVIYTSAEKMRKPSEFMEKIFSAHQTFSPKAWSVEVYGPQKYIFFDILEERKKRAIHFPVFPLPMDVRKGVKDGDIQTLLSPFSNGEVYIHRSMKALIGEICAYPGGLTCDLIDCLGKLARYRWTRHKVENPKWKLGNTEGSLGSRNPITGY
jgi:hypothetical protein